MQLSSAQKKFLRARAHRLKPVVTIGANGLHEGVYNEIDLALSHHELIKVRINAGDRKARDAMAGDIREQSGAAFVQLIGHIAVFYRPADKPVIVLPKT